MSRFSSIILFLFSITTASIRAEVPTDGYVTIKLMGQLGNQMFQIAAAKAYALDHNLSLLIPDLETNKAYNVPYNAKKLFLSKINSQQPLTPPKKRWNEPNLNYHTIPSAADIELFGYFQSEQYFLHRREEILSLFAPPEELYQRIITKYPFLLSDTFVVGIQIRDYTAEAPSGQYHPTKTRSYYEQAMSYFPEDTIFLVSSNNQKLARDCTYGVQPNIIYLQGEDYIEELYTLSLCKSFIIGNSSFGWWAAWLSTAENKVIFAPRKWFAPPYNNEMMTKDIYPAGTILLDD